MAKYLTIVIIALVLALGGMGWLLNRQAGNAALLKAQVNNLMEAQDRAAVRRQKDQATLVAREAKISVQARILADQQVLLNEALSDNKAWTDEPIPETVQKALTNGQETQGRTQ